MEKVIYRDDPVEFERVLRQNLSGDIHTKGSLIDYGVFITIEAERLSIELTQCQNRLGQELASKMRAAQFINHFKTLDLGQIAKILEEDFGFADIAALIRNTDAYSLRIVRRERAKFAANKKHQPKNVAKEKIKEIWATGKYTSRDICAEQECAALDISFSTARKALRGTPTP